MRFQNMLRQELVSSFRCALAYGVGYGSALVCGATITLQPMVVYAYIPASELLADSRLADAHLDNTAEPDAEPGADPDAEPDTEPGPDGDVAPASSESSAPLNLSPEVIEQSPVLQRWLEEVPDIRSDIRNDPSFTTRLQVGYSSFPSSDGTGGFIVGVEDWFLGDTPLTVSADYQQNFRGDRQAYGVDFHYYLLPLGGYINVSPILGYRHAEAADDYNLYGVNVGVRLRVVPSRTGAADITLDQSWLVGDSERLSITQLNVGYAITQELRLSTDLEWQGTDDFGDSRVGVNLEWAL
ncbi:MAG: hypothetical protein AAGC93_04450 [Cyanobacteria bacterium P01_F01_bin.53]